jgi:RND family efflux transporter MFP subunit
MNRRTLIISAVALILIVVAVFAIFRPGKDALPVREAVVQYTTFMTKLPETGVVQVPQLVTIPAGVPGNVALIEVRAGDRVTRGELLATIFNEQISSNVQTAQDSAESAAGRAQSVYETNGALPAQNRSAVVQAQAAVVAARSELTQAQQDLVAGAQSGLGYGGQTAEEQRLSADTALAKAETDLREAKRTFDANSYLYEQKGLSRDALQQSEARYDEALATEQQAKSEREILTGQLAREGQVLRDRVRSAQDALRQAEAGLASAEAAAHESKAGDLAAAQADAEHARADLEFARDQAAHLEVRSPIDGVVESVASEPGDSLRPLQPGDTVTAGQPLFTLSSHDKFVVRTRVDEQDIASVQVGQRAIVSGEDFGSATIEGRVAAISPIAQKSDDPSNTSRQVLTTIALARTLPFLRDGMSVDVDIVTRAQTHVLSVPIDALRTDETGTYVYTVVDGRTRRANVAIGTQNDSAALVLSGVADGDIVVAEKGPSITDDVAVKPAPSPSPGDTDADGD